MPDAGAPVPSKQSNPTPKRPLFAGVEALKQFLSKEVAVPRFMEYALGGIGAVAFSVSIGVGVSIAASDPSPTIWWFTAAAISAVVVVFLLDDVKAVRKLARVAITLIVGLAAMFGVSLGDRWAADKAVAASIESEKQIARESVAEVNRLRVELEKRRVASSSPLKLVALATDSSINYVPGTKIDGIPWRPFYTELDLIASNPTENNYDDVNIVVRPDFPVAKIVQTSNLPGFSSEDCVGLTQQTTTEDVGAHKAIALVRIATDAGYRISLPRIPPRSSLRMLMAVVAMKKSIQPKNPGQPIPIHGNIDTRDFFTEETFAIKDGIMGTYKGTYWYGSPDNVAMFAARPNPERIYVSGHYGVHGITLDVKEEVHVPKGKPQTLGKTIFLKPAPQHK